MATAFGATDFIACKPDRENLVLEKENDRRTRRKRSCTCKNLEIELDLVLKVQLIGGGFALMGKPPLGFKGMQ